MRATEFIDKEIPFADGYLVVSKHFIKDRSDGSARNIPIEKVLRVLHKLETRRGHELMIMPYITFAVKTNDLGVAMAKQKDNHGENAYVVLTAHPTLSTSPEEDVFYLEEQENPKVDLTPNYPNYQVLVGEYVGVKKNRLLFKILSAELKPGQGATDKIVKSLATGLPFGIDIERVRNRKVLEDLSRRGFLGGLGAAALSATGVTGAEAKPLQPKTTSRPQEPINLLSMKDTEAEKILHRAALKAGIKGVELAQFLAQARHESYDFSRMKEVGGKQYFAKLYDPKSSPRTAKILGNTHVGDGVRYHGRGFIQITGRDNYRMAGKALGLPLEQQPELAARPDVAAKIAVWYWKTRVKPYVTNFNDTRAVTQKINPAMRGLQDRHAHFVDYKNIL